MSNEQIKTQTARKALALCIDRIDRAVPVGTPEILHSIRAQLEWLVSYFEGRNTQHEKLKALVFGHYAARELDEADQEFIEALFDAYHVANQTQRGLKIDGNALRPKS